MLYLVEDCFDRIVLFDNKALAAECELEENGRYRIRLSFDALKWTADGKGNETEEPMHDLLEFAVFDENGDELVRHRQWIDGSESEISLLVDELPATAGIDPHFLLIDKNVKNNLVDVVMK